MNARLKSLKWIAASTALLSGCSIVPAAMVSNSRLPSTSLPEALNHKSVILDYTDVDYDKRNDWYLVNPTTGKLAKWASPNSPQSPKAPIVGNGSIAYLS